MGLSRRAKVVFGLAASLLLLLLAFFAVSPTAHLWLHANADQAGHQCNLTRFQQGEACHFPVTFDLQAPVLFVWRRSIPQSETPPSPARILGPPSCGPPAQG